MKTQIKITNDEIKTLLGSQQFEFPKYTTQILNLANQNAQGTRPAVVGQMSELIQEFTGKSISEWKKWYLQKYPNAIEEATRKISEMVDNLRTAIDKIDQKMIEDWVRDLVIIKTFIGLKFQEAILRKVAALLNTNYRLSSPAEEAKGIDGFIGNIPVSIKPESYNAKKGLSETIDSKIIYYKKVKDGISVNIIELVSIK